MIFFDDIYYSRDHLWVKEIAEGLVRVGITDFAQDQLGSVIYVDLPDIGEIISAGHEMGAIESAKIVTDLISPVDGQVMIVNSALVDNPMLINNDPFGLGWLLEIKLSRSLLQNLLTKKDYRQLLEDIY